VESAYPNPLEHSGPDIVAGPARQQYHRRCLQRDPMPGLTLDYR